MSIKERAAYDQYTLDLEAQPQTEITLDELVVTRRPTYTKLPDGSHEWRCTFLTRPDLFHPDRNEVVEASTIQFADDARGVCLRKGELVTLTGTLTNQTELELVGGGKQTLYHILVTNLVVPGRPQEQAAPEPGNGSIMQPTLEVSDRA